MREGPLVEESRELLGWRELVVREKVGAGSSRLRLSLRVRWLSLCGTCLWAHWGSRSSSSRASEQVGGMTLSAVREKRISLLLVWITGW